MAPDTINVRLDKPLNPDSVAPAFNVSVLALVKVPLPDSVPASEITLPDAKLGLTPRGRLQLSLIVFVPVVCVI